MWRIALAYVGALVGAGFASGQELVTFFVAFGRPGFWGIGLVTLLFATSGMMIVRVSQKTQSKNYEQLFAAIFPKALAKVLTMLMSLALWLGLVVMLSGSCALFNQLWQIPQALSFCLLLVLVGLPLCRSGEGFLKLNQYLVPLLLLIAVGISLVFLNQPLNCWQAVSTEMLLPNWGVATCLYWLYNMLLAIVVLVGIPQKPQAFCGVALGAGILGLLAGLLSVCLHLLPSQMQTGQLPMLDLAYTLGTESGLLYALVMAIAMYTTALANCYGLMRNYEQRFKRRTTLLLLILFSTLIFLPFQFATLVGLVYPLLGYLSIPIMVGIVGRMLKKP